jgi:hypothetical protein
MDPAEEIKAHRMKVERMNAEEALPAIDAHSYLIGVYRGLIKPNGNRLRAAIAALPFEKPKLAVVASMGKEDLVEALERARAAREKVIENYRPTQVIEAPKVEPSPEPLDHSKPFAQDNKSRFRRF